jgi:hypothetical protein
MPKKKPTPRPSKTIASRVADIDRRLKAIEVNRREWHELRAVVYSMNGRLTEVMEKFVALQQRYDKTSENSGHLVREAVKAAVDYLRETGELKAKAR